MKPNPTPIWSAVLALGVEPSSCALVGDSLSNIEAAKAAGTPAIGYANRLAKREKFRLAGANEVITSMGEIARVLAGQALWVSHVSLVSLDR
jgi:beta-phosphoglucomutase-like phosphatase (HAD superfamily)